jgi:FkbM family methyltransferase
MVYMLYLRILERYQRNPNSLYASLVRQVIHWAVAILEFRQQFQFPERASGGWRRIERFRFELLMSWFEHESVKRVRQVVRPGMTAIDIGAHFGYYTRLLSELVGPTGRVLAFEPNSENFKILQHNLAPRKYRNVELFNCAVGDRDDVLPLCMSPGNSNHNLIHGGTEAESLHPVKCVRLDSVLEKQGIEKVDFIKSDTESAGALDLAGMQLTIARSPQLHFLIEFSSKALCSESFVPEELLEPLRQMGFEMEMISPDPPTKDIYESVLCRRSVEIPKKTETQSIPQSMEDVFSWSFFGNTNWESYSGPGSSLDSTVAVRAELPTLIRGLGTKTFLDIPCGDLNWMKEVELGVEKYIGADVIRKLIEINNQRFGNETRTFLALDITKDELPEVDLVFCRDCLVHFSYEDILRAIASIKKSNSKYLLTTTFTNREDNQDIVTGYWRPLNLQRAPFYFPDPLRIINENYTGADGLYTDKSLGLWRVKMLP